MFWICECTVNCLSDIAQIPTDIECVQLLAEKTDLREFIDLLKRCLRSNKSNGEAMNCPFTTHVHLVNYAHRNNVNASVEVMEVCCRMDSMIHTNARHPDHELFPKAIENMTYTFDYQVYPIIRERGSIHDNHINQSYRGRNFAS
uniref:Homeodomain-interacting protein kinase 2 n=1 Tax=Culex pipiens TaxID=7175 RepID=A0A8D8AFT2_CULPI